MRRRWRSIAAWAFASELRGARCSTTRRGDERTALDRTSPAANALFLTGLAAICDGAGGAAGSVRPLHDTEVCIDETRDLAGLRARACRGRAPRARTGLRPVHLGRDPAGQRTSVRRLSAG